MTVWLSLLGGLLTLDQTSLGQFMAARPLVSATVTGWLLGDPATGLLVGAVLEVLFLPAFPVGGARFPEGGPAGVVGAAAALAGAGTSVGAAVATGVAFGACWGLLAGWSVGGLRRLNERLVVAPRDGRVPSGRLVLGHLGALGADFVRGTAVTLAGLLAVRIVGSRAAAVWPMDTSATVFVLGAAAVLSAGGLLPAFGGWSRRRVLLVGGVVTGALTGWIL